MILCFLASPPSSPPPQSLIFPMSWQLPPDVYQGFYTQGLCHVKQKKQKRKKTEGGGDGWTLAGEPSLHLPSPPPPPLPPLSWLSRVILDWVATGSPEKGCFFLCIWKKNKQITFGCCLKGSPDLIHPLEEKVFCQRRNCTFRNKNMYSSGRGEAGKCLLCCLCRAVNQTFMFRLNTVPSSGPVPTWPPPPHWKMIELKV